MNWTSRVMKRLSGRGVPQPAAHVPISQVVIEKGRTVC
jgi:hypothetical protein